MAYCENMREELLNARKIPIVSTIEDLAIELLISEDILKKINKHSYTYYKEFMIPKKSKKNEERRIIAPKSTLKVIQAWILRNILEKVELHNCAMAYRKGSEFGIKNNALRHREKEYIMKVDFKDFFPSIKRKEIFFMFNELGYSRDISNCFANICSYKGLLPQGAVTSPYICNIILKEFDEKLYEYCISNDITYTRYADDIILSCNRKTPLTNSEQFLINLIDEYSFLEINNDKSFKIFGNDTRKIVTGLLINNEDVRVTRKYKRNLRAQIYNEIKLEGNIPSEEINGKLAFIKEIDSKSFNKLSEYIKKIGIESRF